MRLNLVTVLSALAPLAAASPLDLLGLAAWDVEGFAKDNPIGTTTGGKGGATVTVTNAAEFSAAVAGDAPKVVLVKGEIAFPARPKIGSNKSIIGVGSTAHITNKGLDVFNSTNVIIRNLKISFIQDNDCITIRNSTRVWVDHNEFASDITKGPDFYVRFFSTLISASISPLTTYRMAKSTSSAAPTTSPSRGTTSTTTGNPRWLGTTRRSATSTRAICT